MEMSTMGKVIVTAKLINLQDLYIAQCGLKPEDQVRSVEVTDAMADTGATSLMAPRSVIAQLGLRPFRTRQARTCTGRPRSSITRPSASSFRAGSSPATWPKSRTIARC